MKVYLLLLGCLAYGTSANLFDGALFVAERGSIVSVSLVSKLREQFMTEINTTFVSVDVHFNKCYVFFADNNAINRFEWNTSDLVPIVTRRVEGSVRLAVDWVHDKLYWMSDKYQTIEMADLDGRNKEVLVDNIGPFRFPNNIAVDPFEKALYFVSDYALFKANLDGTKIRQLGVDRNQRHVAKWGIRSIALDRDRKRIYLSRNPGENNSAFIHYYEYSGLEGTNNLLPTDVPQGRIGCLEVFQNVLYFHHMGQFEDSIHSMPLSGCSGLKKIYSPRYNTTEIWSIKVFHPDSQTLSKNLSAPGNTVEVCKKNLTGASFNSLSR